MITVDTLRFELEGRFREIAEEIGKHYISVRWEPLPGVARVGACITDYSWDTRLAVIKTLLDFEKAHADEFALDFDVFPLESLNDEAFAEA